MISKSIFTLVIIYVFLNHHNSICYKLSNLYKYLTNKFQIYKIKLHTY